jgi:hypothetical protein
MSDQIYKRWQSDLDRIWKETIELVHTDDVFWQVQAIVQANTSVRDAGGRVFLRWMLDSYITAMLVGIRALVDGTKGTISFKRLLEAMERDAPTVLTRERYRRLYRPEMAFRADIDFDRLAGAGKEHLPPSVIRLDRLRLERAVAAATAFANERVTHISARPAVESALTQDEIRYSLRAVSETLSRYMLLLHAGSMSRVVPSIAAPWLDVFRVAWLPKGAPLPGYITLDELPRRDYGGDKGVDGDAGAAKRNPVG